MTDSAGLYKADFDHIAQLASGTWGHNEQYHGYLFRQLPARCCEALEVGCGAGGFSRLLATHAEHVVALDLSPEMISLARATSAHLPNVDFAVADATNWAWPQERFDCIATIATLHHLPLATSLGMIKKALRPGAKLVALDLYQAQTPADHFFDLIAVPVSMLLRFVHTGQLRQPAAARQAWAAHGKHDTYLTLDEIRRTCTELLPGVHVKRHLLWRYSLVWTKPPRMM